MESDILKESETIAPTSCCSMKNTGTGKGTKKPHSLKDESRRPGRSAEVKKIYSKNSNKQSSVGKMHRKK